MSSGQLQMSPTHDACRTAQLRVCLGCSDLPRALVTRLRLTLWRSRVIVALMTAPLAHRRAAGDEWSNSGAAQLVQTISRPREKHDHQRKDSVVGSLKLQSVEYFGTPHSSLPALIMTRHLAVWIDHDRARIFHVDPERIEEATVEAPPHRIHLRHPKGLVEGESPHDSKRFFREVARALEGAEAVLVTGPSTTKLGFFKFLHEHDPTLEPRIVGIETVAHTSDGQLLRYAQQYFELSDPMQ
jgi:hypothetical protein